MIDMIETSSVGSKRERVPLHCLFQSLHKESSGIGAALDGFEQTLVIGEP